MQELYSAGCDAVLNCLVQSHRQSRVARDGDPEKLREYKRLCGKFRQIRPDDTLEEIEKLIGLVENRVLKEEGDYFVVRASEESDSYEFGKS